ncbi:MAG: pilus assembly protein PilM [Nitrospirota bacterium]|nr:pilus assembly protein PilM [Nitrospirota bacterium]MDH4362407.1 pilus assembly protein PilM [Nitrospirota bacterium]
MKTTWKEIASRTGVYFRKSEDVAGVDVGSRFIKSVMLQRGRSCPTLKSFAIGSVTQRSCHDFQAKFEKDRHIVQVLQDQLNPPPQTVGISVSGPQVLLKILSLPNMTEKDLRAHLALELDRYIPLEVQDVVWDVYYQKGTVFLKDGKQENFLVVAKREFVEGRIRQFEDQGMKVRFVDVDTFALVNMVAYNYGNEGAWLIVHLGPTGILLVIMEEGHLVHFRQVSYEAEWYGDLLDRVLLSHETSDEGYQLGTSETLLLQQFFKETTDQVLETLKHFPDMPEKAVGSGVLLSGGYSVVEGLSAKLADSLKMPVSLVDPFKKIVVPAAMQQDCRFQKAAPLFGVAVGVALRGVVSS